VNELISIICVYNNESTLNNWLITSLRNQSEKFELILIDNCDGKFKSAASALNDAGKKATGEYLCFVHQDIHFCRKTDLENIESELSKLDNLGVAGFAGMSSEGNTFEECQRNMIIEYENPPKIWGHPTDKPELVQTVDECIFIVPKNVFHSHPFDDVTCDDWHFYSVDYCLSVISSGLDVYTIPFPIHHQSLGFSQKFRLNWNSYNYVKNFYRSLSKILRKHKTGYRKIFTTNGIYRTDISPMIQDLRRMGKILSKFK
jgi:hypothetical protein